MSVPKSPVCPALTEAAKAAESTHFVPQRGPSFKCRPPRISSKGFRGYSDKRFVPIATLAGFWAPLSWLLYLVKFATLARARCSFW